MMVVGTNNNVLKDIMELSNTFEVDIRDIRSSIIKQKDGTSACQLTILMSKKSIINVEAFAEELKLRLSPLDFKLYHK